MNCIFCKIAEKSIFKEIVFENEGFMAFNDIHPKAPQHVLIIPKAHIASVKELDEEGEKMAGRMIGIARRIAEKVGMAGYKLIFNVGPEAGQTVEHLHLHCIGGWESPPAKVEV
ncbi:MAG: HIT domain-containing protein [Patescibacteria group bacterium]